MRVLELGLILEEAWPKLAVFCYYLLKRECTGVWRVSISVVVKGDFWWLMGFPRD